MAVSKEKDIASIVDHITTTDVGGRTTIGPLSEAVKEIQGEHPAMDAAEALYDTVGEDDSVIVLSGFPIPPTMTQETDGPPGAVSVARALTEGVDANVVIACEEHNSGIFENTARAGGLNVVDREMNLTSKNSTAVEPFPTDREKAKVFAGELVDELDPSAVVSVEKVGSNERGEYHNSAGYSVTEYTSKVEELLEIVDDDTTTIAVGDAGNEVGLGTIEETIKEKIQFGEECQCGCGGGIADTTKVDILAPAAVSNWGAYGITACLSYHVGQSLIHDPDVEERMLNQCAMAGGIDGPTGKTNGWVDGLPPSVSRSIVRLIQESLQPSMHERRGESSAAVK